MCYYSDSIFLMNNQLAALAAVLRAQKTTVVSRWKAVVTELAGAAGLDASTLRDHIPQFLDEMIAAIASRNESAVVGKSGLGSPLEHGSQRLAAGFNIKEVVLEYNILRGAVLDVAEQAGLRLTANECGVINHIIDDAVAGAVDIFAREQASQRQRQREEHLAFVAHDVRTPLNAISLIATVLSEELGPEARDLTEMLRALQRNVQRIEELVQHILKEPHDQKTSNGLNFIRREMDLWPLVHQLVQGLQPVTATAKIKIRNLVPRHLTVNADAILLTRVLQNLVGNAIKFSPGGEIDIGAREISGGMECWVQDNGSGIAPERLDCIFDKHETDADPTRAGLGLGLAICKQIIEGHGGEISVQSLPGHGATFRFTIPPPISK
jgi:two-component system, OmpR family, phosphate regulon sensor histidine kinase PhoR